MKKFVQAFEDEYCIYGFTGKYAFLSNFHNSPMKIEGILYPTAEHAFQAAKTTDRFKKLKISRALGPGTAKRMGRRVELRPDWEEVKVPIMFDILVTKFTSRPEYTQALIDTGSKALIEGNDWHDNFWGSCCCLECEGKLKANMLGRLLEEVRVLLRTGVDFSTYDFSKSELCNVLITMTHSFNLANGR